MSDIWLLMRSGGGEASWNMAVDEALLSEVDRIGVPIVRCYSWSEPAASFGYFQRHADIVEATDLRPLVRRCTGGGLVPHDNDWTYSVVFPPGHEWFGVRAEVSYRRIHEWIAGAMIQMGLPAELAAASEALGSGRCFAGYERFDVLQSGRKIAGAAQRRNRRGLLIQGSIQLPEAIDRERWAECFLRFGQKTFAIEWREMESDAAMVSVAERLRTEKYGSIDYVRRR
jgi:lipoyl(octanoyl) transferase